MKLSKSVVPPIIAAIAALFSPCGNVLGQEKVIVERSALLRWDEIVRNDAHLNFWSIAPRAIHPPEYLPAGIPQGRSEGKLVKPGAYAASVQADVTRTLTSALDFEAIPDNNVTHPPDTQGAVGPSHIMTMLNTEVRIQNKSGGVISTVALESFWAALNGGPFDPRLHYDVIHGRWLASCSSRTWVFFAISSTSDPEGSWSFYAFVADPIGATWADYPRLGFNSKWIVIIASMAGPNGSQKMWVIDKSTALAGGPLTVTIFHPTATFAGQAYSPLVFPCVTYGSEPTLYLVSAIGERPDSVQLAYLSRITGTGGTPIWSMVPGSDSTGTGSFPTGARFEVAMVAADQLGSSTVKIETGGYTQGAVFRNGNVWFTMVNALPDSYESMNRMAIFWFEVDPQAMPRPVIQSGVIDGGPGTFCTYSSIAVNAANDVCIGFSQSDASMYVQASYTGRLSTHPPGMMIPVQTLKRGEGVYWKSWPDALSYCRWGDYSNTCVDPTDDMTFWTIQEYAGTPVGTGNGSGRWGTRWGKIEPASNLPVQISSFSADVRAGNRVQLEWTTLSEIENFGFEVQKSESAPSDFRTIAGSFLPGHGTTTLPRQYRYCDTTASPGQWYYRLNQIDLDGSSHYSQSVRVDLNPGVMEEPLPASFALFQNYPNPFNPSTTIGYRLAWRSHVTLAVYNTLGQRVSTLVDQHQPPGYYEVLYDASGMSSGVYFCRFRAGDYMQTRKLLLVH